MRLLASLLIALLLPLAPTVTLKAEGGPGPNLELLGVQALVFAENAARNFPGEYNIRISRPPTVPPLKPGKVTFDAERMSKQEPVGRFFVVFRVAIDGIPAATTRVELEGTWSGTLYQAKNTLGRKTVITLGDLEPIRFEGIPPVGAVKDLPKDIRMRQPISAGKVLTQMHIEPIPLINATDRVRVLLQNGPLQIYSDATARSNGARGERVRLEMDGSKKMVQGVVTGPCAAMIDLRDTRQTIEVLAKPHHTATPSGAPPPA